MFYMVPLPTKSWGGYEARHAVSSHQGHAVGDHRCSGLGDRPALSRVGRTGRLAAADLAAGDDLAVPRHARARSEEHTSELQSRQYLVCRLLLEKKNKNAH